MRNTRSRGNEWRKSGIGLGENMGMDRWKRRRGGEVWVSWSEQREGEEKSVIGIATDKESNDETDEEADREIVGENSEETEEENRRKPTKK